MRLIDADELKKCAIPCEIHNGALTDLCVPLYQIDNAPTVERPQGEWIIDDWSKIIECNKCRGQAPIDITSGEQYRSNFCPICGADMRGDKNGKS